jgi:type IV fimbrial biogenesis protein FimT
MPPMKYVPQRGFTLLELMITITVAGVLLGLAIPSFRDFTRNNRVIAAQNDLVTALNVARSESLRRSRPVTVCASTDGLACATETDWAGGWIVFTDTAGVAAGSVDAGDDEVLQRWDSLGGDVTFTANNAFVQYLPTGASAGPLQVDIAWAGCGGPKLHRVQVGGSGSLTSQILACTP